MTHSLRMLSTLPALENMVCFEAVARCGSFTRAAQELCITQSAVSKQIKALEEALGCALFDRHARGIRLSTAGADFLQDMMPLLHGMQRAVIRTKHAQTRQAVSITCSVALAHYWLFPRLVRFNQQHPHIMVNVLSSNQITVSDCLDCDLGILYGGGAWSTLENVELCSAVIYPACSPQLCVATPARVEDLLSLPLIQLDTSDWDCPDWHDWFAYFGVDYQIPGNAITFNQLTLTLNAAVDGLGVSLVYDSMARQAIAAGKLKRLGNFPYHTDHGDHLVHARHRPLRPHAAVLRDWLIASAKSSF